MKKLLKIFMLRLTVILLSAVSVKAQWANVGCPGFSSGSANFVSLQFDSSDNLFIGSRDGGLSGQGAVRTYNGSSWVSVGSNQVTGNSVSYPQFRIHSDNNLYMAYQDDTSGDKAAVAKFNGTTWSTIGNVGFSAGIINDLGFDLNSNNVPYVSYRDDANGQKATVMKYDGINWVNVGSAGFTPSSAYYTSLRIGPNDTPFVAFRDGLTNRVSVMKFNGSSWVYVGSAGFSASIAWDIQLVFDNNNVPHVIYSDFGSSRKATVMKFNGTSWVNVGSAGFSAGNAQRPSLVFDSNNTPYAAYRDDGNGGKATVKKYNGSSWATVGIVGFSAGSMSYPSLAFDSNDNLYIGFADQGTGWKTTVMKFGTVANPAIPIALSGPTTFCSGSSVTLTASACSNSSFQWKNNGTAISGATSASYIATTTGSYTVDVTFSSNTVTSAAITVTANPAPNAAIVAGGPTSLCAGDSVTLTASSGTGYTYQWQLNGSNISGATSASYTASVAGSYTVVVAANSCTATSTPIVVTVNAAPTATITTSGPTTFCAGGSVTLSASSASSYQWQIGGMDISGATSSSYSTSNSGNYSVKITDANGCSATSSLTTVTEKGVWTSVTCPGFTSGRVFTTALAVDTNNNIYVAYQDNGNSNKTSVQKYDGTSWTQVGATGFSSAGDRQDFAIGADNLPYIAVSEYGIGASVYKFDGTNWNIVGSAGFSSGAVSNTSLAIDGNGNLYVSYRDNANGSKLTVMRYNGSSWSAVGGVGISAGSVYDPQIAIDQNNMPHVVYGDNSLGGKATVLKYNGSSWTALGGAGFSTNFVVNSTITIGPGGAPYIAFKDGFPQGPATVLKYNGTSWVPVGKAGFSQGFIDHITLGFDSQGKLIASYRDDANNLSITTQKFDNGVWRPIGAQGITTNTANQGSFVIDSDDNMYVAFRDFNAGSRLTVMKTGPTAATAIVANGSTEICTGSSVQLSVSACNGSSYQWMKNGTIISGANSATYNANAAGTYTVSITSNGCPSVSDSLVITEKQATAITSCASDTSIDATTGNCDATLNYNVTAIGASTPTMSYVFTGATTGSGNGTGSGSVFNTGVTNVKVIASDSCGNDTCSFNVTVVDNQDPTITAPANVTVNADAGQCSATNVNLGTPTTSDNCGVGTTTNNGLSSYPVGTTTVTWTVTDVNGNTATATQTVTVKDNQDPVLVGVPANASASCDDVPAAAPVTATDNCSSASVSYNEIITTGAMPINGLKGFWTFNEGSGTTTVDQSGNGNNGTLSSGASWVTGQVGSAVQFSGTSKQYVEIPNTTGGDLDAQYSISMFAWLYPGTDGNKSTPIIQYNPNGWGTHLWQTGSNQLFVRFVRRTGSWTSHLSANTLIPNQWNCVGATYDYNSGIATLWCNGVAVATRNIGTTQLYTNTNIRVGTVNFDSRRTNAKVDNVAIYDRALTPTEISTLCATTCPQNYTITRMWTATDAANNSVSASQTITVSDTTKPVLTVPSNITMNADVGQCNATATFQASATDNCSNNVTITYSQNSGTSFPVGTTAVNVTAKDECGNTTTGTFNVTVIDNQNPSVGAPAGVTVNADAGQCYATNVGLGSPAVFDNCGVATVTNNAPSTFPVDTTIVTWTVTDVNGNSTTRTQEVIVEDNQDPTITAPANVTVNADAGQCAAANVVLGTPVTSDNCGVASTTNNGLSSYPVGSTTVTWTVTDIHGNTSTATQTVTVIDNQNPSVGAPAGVTVNADAGQCYATNVGLGSPAVFDNCGIATVTNDAPSTFPVDTTIVTWTVTDVNGNSTTRTQEVIVEDNQAPTITAPADVTINADAGLCSASEVNIGSPITGDNCGVASTTNNGLATYPTGVTTVTWTVIDIHGNTSSTTQTVTVVDNQNPTVITQNRTVYLDASGNGIITAGDVDNGSSDNCGIQSISLDRTSFGCNDAGVNTVSLTVVDLSNNSATGTATITVLDTVKPTISCPTDITVSCLTTPANTGAATAADACGIDTITYSDASTYNSNPSSPAHYVYTITRTWTATDNHGNTSSCTQVISVEQLQLTAVVNNVTCNGAGNGSIDLTVQGGIGTLSYSWNNNATTEDINSLSAGTYSVTVTDAAGCTATATYTITEPTMLSLTAIGMNPNPTVSGQIANTIFLGYGPQSVTLSSTASGGTPGYSYSWTPTTGVANTSSATTSVSPTVTTTYTLTVTDSNGCTKSVSKTIYVRDVRHGNNKVIICYKGKTKKVSKNAVANFLNKGATLGECFKLTVSKTKVTCYGGNDGALDVTVKGGIAPFSYSWNTGDTTEDLTGLTAGNYTLTATAANGEVTSRTFKVKQNSKIKIYDYVSDVKCYGDSNGKILISVSGGKSPYTYLWSDNSTSKNRYNLSAGNYSVVVTDSKGCTMSDSFTVAQPATPIIVSGTVTNVNCSSGYSGAIDLTVSGGTGPYTYYWSKSNQTWSWWWFWWWYNKCSNQDLSGVSSGTYTVLVKDANGCTVTKSFTIAPAPKPNVSISVSPNPTVSGQAGYTIFEGYGPQSVTLSANASGGTTPYSYSWTPGWSLSNTTANSTTASPNNTTKYYVTVTDANGCSETVSRRIYVEDVRWYGERIRICYNGRNKKVSYNSVAWYLANGATLGNCSSACKGCPDPDDEDTNEMQLNGEANTAGDIDGADEGLSRISKFAAGIKVYPNPNNGTFTVSLPKHVKGGEITFRDVTGKVIKQDRFLPNAQLKFNMPDVADGMYMIEVKNGTEIYKARVVITR